MKSVALGALLVAAHAVAASDQKPSSPEGTEAQTLFANTCLLHYTSGQKIPQKFNNNPEYLHLPDEQARRFLDDNKGDVWVFRTQHSQYAVALASNSLCTLYSRTADTEQEWKQFDKFTSRIFTRVEKLVDPKKQSGEQTYQSVLYLTQRDPIPIVTLTTDSNKSGDRFSAKISVLWLPKELALSFRNEISKPD